MNPEIKQRWVAALRSGEYKQGRNFLFRDGRHCCLGVLCDLYTKETGIAWTAPSGQSLPSEVIKWSEVASWSPRVDVGHGKMGLAQINDSGEYDFPTIADLIERSL